MFSADENLQALQYEDKLHLADLKASGSILNSCLLLHRDVSADRVPVPAVFLSQTHTYTGPQPLHPNRGGKLSRLRREGRDHMQIEELSESNVKQLKSPCLFRFPAKFRKRCNGRKKHK